MTNQITIDLRELERRIAECDRRIKQTEVALNNKQVTMNALRELRLPQHNESETDLLRLTALLRTALLDGLVQDVANLENLLIELQNALSTMRAMKFGVVA